LSIAALIRDAGWATAADRLFTALYDDLHRLAERQLVRNGNQLTLGTTTLLHEAYINIADRSGASFPDRAHFLAYAARAMRGLIIDYGRQRRAQKRGASFTSRRSTTPCRWWRPTRTDGAAPGALGEAWRAIPARSTLAELVSSLLP
jgi:RNA polymerase sigma factor (TIGR02999 family)